MKLKIAVLPGDGIGPEIMKQGIAVMDAIAGKFGHEFTYEEALVGACAIDAVGDAYPEATHDICMKADAVLFAAVGDLKYDNDPTSKIRPEQGLLAIPIKNYGWCRTRTYVAVTPNGFQDRRNNPTLPTSHKATRVGFEPTNPLRG